MICAWIDTSRALTASSATISCGPQRQRAGDGDALALPAAERVGYLSIALAGSPHRSSSVRDARVELAALPAEPVHDQRLADDVADLHPRVQRRVGILEDDLHVAPQRRAARSPVGVGDVGPSKTIRPDSRLVAVQDR